jgi:DNA topoisomerase-1
MPRLRRVDCSGPGIRRRRRGKGFEYFYEDGTPVSASDRARIRSLAVPPAWKDVWICTHPYGHLQATGTDAAGRKQYLYHEAWRVHRDREKFDRMIAFGEALPKLRREIASDLRRRGLVRERVLGCAVRLLDLGLFRIGGEQYAEENETYGLATLRKRHVRLERGAAVFDYEAKGSQRHIRVVTDKLVLPTVRALKRRTGGGSELLAYRNGGRSWADVRSEHINEYLKESAGSEFSAKDFRTWNATVLAAVALAVSAPAASSRSARKRAMTRAVKEVAYYMGNTPAVCRASYIDPRVFDRFRDGVTIGGALEQLGDDVVFGQPSTQGAIEEAVLDLLEEEPSAALERVA